ncbi:MAG: hypothetical protein [Caudoviricetes sp.]|nr:MAG: hypothetical protein [Caudoviricetes sp.]
MSFFFSRRQTILGEIAECPTISTLCIALSRKLCGTSAKPIILKQDLSRISLLRRKARKIITPLDGYGNCSAMICVRRWKFWKLLTNPKTGRSTRDFTLLTGTTSGGSLLIPTPEVKAGDSFERRIKRTGARRLRPVLLPRLGLTYPLPSRTC